MPRSDSDDALRSALGRLSLAVFVVEKGEALRPLNARAQGVLAAEALRDDVLQARPGHPLSTYVKRLLEGDVDADAPNAAVLAFPSGSRYRVEASMPSTKGRNRLLMLVLQEEKRAPSVDDAFEAFGFTAREREIGQCMVRGAASNEICAELGIGAETLKTHVKNMLLKSRTRTRTELVARLLGAA